MPRSPHRTRMRLAALVFSLTLLLVMTTLGIIPRASSTTTAFSFASAGDTSTLTAGDGLNSLNRLAGSRADFFLGVGDYSYQSSMTGDVWCSQFKAKYSNIEIGPGNHDTGETNDTSGTRSYERYVAGCSFTLSSQVVCGPVAGQCYGKEYYFDYPSVNPIARFIMISPRVFNVTGVCTTTCNAVAKSPCNDTTGCWPYNKNDTHYNWTASAVDSARTTGIKWVVVGMHKVCISAGAESCNIGTNLFNMLVAKKVDLILQGHDHTYERSKQLAFNSACTGFTTNSSYVLYNSSCVVDDGSRGFYTAGGHGFLKYAVSTDRIDIQTDFAGTYQDSFSVVSPTTSLSASFTYSPASPTIGAQVTFTATASGGTSPYSFDWNFGDNSTAQGNPVSHSYTKAGSYNVALTVRDSAAPTPNTQTMTNPVSVSPTPLSLSVSGPSTATTGSPVAFTATASGGTAPYTFAWTATGGSPSSGGGSSFTTTFNAAGTFVVSATVTDANSQTSNASQQIAISAPIPPLSASFTYSPSSPLPVLPVTFTGSATGGTQPYSFTWDFGDGSTATGQSVDHSYLLPGAYTVTLTVTDAGGQTAKAYQTVTVTIL
ncbi:PKD domain-containing protein [Candidatus Bathyarchaeota archaeon]|nr:MAG: PKD domain-containing protein [Candidatus Bathyarchaeota archaeon]